MKKIENLTPGQTVYEPGNRKYKAANARPFFRVEVLEVDTENNKVKASWNDQPAKWFGAGAFNRWRLTKPD